jgi:prenyltransferase beta subunit
MQLESGFFMGGPCLGKSELHGHLANTYTALCILIMCGNDLSELNPEQINEGLKKFQRCSGAMSMLQVESETDLRSCYCAAAIYYLMKLKQPNLKPTFNCTQLSTYVKSLRTY